MIKKIILLVISILILYGFVLLIFKPITMKEIHVLPNNFQGVVMIIHDQKKGIDVIKEKGSLVYRIPNNGILITKAPLNSGFKDIKYYFEMSEKRKEIKYVWDFPNDSNIYVFGGSTGTYGQGDKKIKCTTYLVGQSNDVDSLSKILGKMQPFKILKQQ